MLDKTRRTLGMDAITPYLRAFLERGNMEVMRQTSTVVLAVCTLALMSTFSSLEVWSQRPDDMVRCYRIALVGMMATASLFGKLSENYLLKSNPRPGLSNAYLTVYIVLMVGLSLWITILDYATMGRYFFLLVTLFVVFGLFFIPPLFTVVCEAAVYLVVHVGLASIGLLSPLQLVILAAYLLAILAVSSSNYRTRKRAGRITERIAEASRHDELTGVLNRRALDEDMHLFVGYDLHVILADIDEFKYFNDLYGHATGDQLLKSLASTLGQSFGSSRTYRFAGDEFVVVFPGGDDEDVRARLDSWRSWFHNDMVDGKKLQPTSSAGCVHGHVDSEDDVRDLLRIADILLMRSKESGRDQVSYAKYSDGLLRDAITQSSLRELPEGSLDPLTGLIDLDHFMARASQVAPLLLEKGHSVSFVYFNVVNLKDYNLKHGFERGDELLRQVAKTLQDVFPNRILSRFSDDRFCLMTEEEVLPEAIERTCALVSGARGGKLIPLRAGVYRYTSPQVEVRYACDCARMACESLRGLYDMPYRYYTNELRDRMERRSRVLSSFRNALDMGYVQPFYQPIIRSASDRVCEFEVLARWIDPGEGVMSPADFVPALEDAHLIHLLDLHIVEEVCKNFHRFDEQGFGVCPVSVNFSRADFEACDVVSEVVALLDRYEIPHYLLRVELTESALAEDSDHIRVALERFRALGMQVWMDDFGSGYSALNVLREYDFDLVKFDMSFVQDMDTSKRSDSSRTMLTNLVSMAKELGLQTLIEGVENLDQLLFLRSIAFEKVQGYVFGKPQSFDETCERISTGDYVLEEADERGYYDKVGRINLMQPIDAASGFDPLGLAEGVPAAVIERSYDGSLRYLEYNMAYLRRLERLGTSDEVRSGGAASIVDWDGSERVYEVMDALRSTDAWLTVQSISDDRALGYARCVARVPNSEAFAFLFYAPPR